MPAGVSGDQLNRRVLIISSRVYRVPYMRVVYVALMSPFIGAEHGRPVFGWSPSLGRLNSKGMLKHFSWPCGQIVGHSTRGYMTRRDSDVNIEERKSPAPPHRSGLTRAFSQPGSCHVLQHYLVRIERLHTKPAQRLSGLLSEKGCVAFDDSRQA